MGVKDLWEVLDEVKESRKLDLLCSKKIAIDLSGWVVQAETRKGLNLSKYPYVKLLYFRVRHLLLHGIHPVFILEGKMPEIKEKEFRRRNNLENNNSESSTRSKLDNSLKQCQKLLTSLGIPCLKAAGEAEAYCAYLCLHKKVDAVMTEDSDAILYGADPVYRGFKIENEDVIEYSLKSEKNKLKIDRRKCVALALLLGCDYGDKVSTIGVATVSKFLLETKERDVDILLRFQDWKKLDESKLFPEYNSKQEKLSHCSYCGHIGKKSTHDKEGCRLCASGVCVRNSETPCSCAWHKNNEIFTAHKSEMKIYQAVKNIEDFPNDKLIDEYLNYTDEIPDDDSLEWKCPIIKDFKDKTSEFMAPTFDCLKEILPLISAWQFQKLEKVTPMKNYEFLLQPLKIKKRKTIKKVKYFVIEWNLKDEENFTVVETEEQESIFQKAYPNIVEEFFNTKDKLKQKKKTKLAAGNKKISEYFSSKKTASPVGGLKKQIVDEDSEPHLKKPCLSLNTVQ